MNRERGGAGIWTTVNHSDDYLNFVINNLKLPTENIYHTHQDPKNTIASFHKEQSLVFPHIPF